MNAPLSSLPLLIELAGRERDEAATRCARLQTQLHQLERQLDALANYAGDYARRGHQRRLLGMDAAASANQSAFVGRIDQVRETQKAELERLRALAEAERQTMFALERRLKSLETLATRQTSLLDQLRARQEQKITDELATQASLRRRNEEDPWT